MAAKGVGLVVVVPMVNDGVAVVGDTVVGLVVYDPDSLVGARLSCW